MIPSSAHIAAALVAVGSLRVADGLGDAPITFGRTEADDLHAIAAACVWLAASIDEGATR